MTFKHKLARRLALLRDAFVVAALAALACEKPVALTDTGSTIRVQISPKSVTLLPAGSIQLMAVAVTSTGDTANIGVNWSVTGGSITDTSTNSGRHYGRYKAGADTGKFKVIAKGNQGSASDTAVVTVVPVPVASVVVSPAVVGILVGATVQLTATTLDSAGGVLTGRSVSWATSVPAAATVSTSGLVSGKAAGSATITATSEGKSGTAVITVTAPPPPPPPAPVASVTVTPVSANVDEGKTVQLTATLKDSSSNVLTGRVVTWSSDNTSIATVTTSGLVTGKVAGTAMIIATSEGQSDTAAITVVHVPVAAVTVTPSSASVSVGGTTLLTAILKDAAGNTLSGRVVSWVSDNAAVAAVSSTGRVTGAAAGSATITATSESKSGTSAITVTPLPPGGPLPVFPGAEGFGATTPAGRGGTVYRVTNLNDAGTGSFRAALAASGPRVVVFEVSGTIELTSNLIVNNPYVTIAGQTAPSPGITLKNAALQINTHDVLVQHLRIRVGDGPTGPSLATRDGLDVYGYNIVADHMSVSWAIDENSSTTTAGNRHDITISNSIISEGLENTGTPEYSKGFLIGQTAQNIALIRCLLAHNKDRNPYAKGDTRTLVVNNVVYNWGGSKAFSIDDWNGNGANFTTAVGNVYIHGVNTGSGRPIHIYSMVPPTALLYVADNSVNRAAPPADPWTLVTNDVGTSIIASVPPVWVTPLTVLANANVEANVLANSGARPAERDVVDVRIVNDVKNGTGQIIDSPSQVGGWPVLSVNTRPLTLPANPNGDDDGDGYTNLEEWLFQFSAQVEGR